MRKCCLFEIFGCRKTTERPPSSTLQLRMAILLNGSCHGMYLMDEDPQITYLWEKENEENRVSPKKTFRFLSSFHRWGFLTFTVQAFG